MVFFSISRLLPPPPHEFAKATFIRKTGALFVEGGLGRIDEAACRLQFGRLAYSISIVEFEVVISCPPLSK